MWEGRQTLERGQGLNLQRKREGILGNVRDNMTGTAIKASASEPEQGRHGLGLLDCFYLFPLLRTPHSLDLSTSILKNPDYPLIKFISRC